MGAACPRSRSRPDRRALLVAAVAAVVAGCGPASQPFRAAGKGLAPPETFQDGETLGIFIAGVDNAPDTTDAALRQAITETLRARGVPASHRTANRRSLMVVGESAWPDSAAPDGTPALDIRWQIIDGDGQAVGTFAQRTFVAPADWAGGDPVMVVSVAEDLADRLTALLGLAATESTPSAPPTYPEVAVAAVEGAPGDGDTALADAMRTALARRGVPVRDDPAAGTIVIRATIDTRRGPRRETVAILWSVSDADGAALGTIEQANDIEPGQLDGAWGPIAAAVADGAADGMMNLLARTGGARLQPYDALLQSAPGSPQANGNEGSQP